MTKARFGQLFRDNLEIAAQNAEQQLGRRVPRSFLLKLYGSGSSGAYFTFEQCLENIYIDQNNFYRIIDLAIIAVSRDRCVCFIRISGHKPSGFEQTWNVPRGNGPFKQLLAEKIQYEE